MLPVGNLVPEALATWGGPLGDACQKAWPHFRPTPLPGCHNGEQNGKATILHRSRGQELLQELLAAIPETERPQYGKPDCCRARPSPGQSLSLEDHGCLCMPEASGVGNWAPTREYVHFNMDLKRPNLRCWTWWEPYFFLSACKRRCSASLVWNTLSNA